MNFDKFPNLYQVIDCVLTYEHGKSLRLVSIFIVFVCFRIHDLVVPFGTDHMVDYGGMR